MKDTEIKITASRYIELLRSEDLLEMLRAYGVDNWEGWDEAISAFHEEHGSGDN